MASTIDKVDDEDLGVTVGNLSQNNGKLVYYHSYGDEDVIGSEISIYKYGETYTITFSQDSLYDENFILIKPGISARLIDYSSKTTNRNAGEGCTIYTQTQILKVKGICNPAPEELFIYGKAGEKPLLEEKKAEAVKKLL